MRAVWPVKEHFLSSSVTVSHWRHATLLAVVMFPIWEHLVYNPSTALVLATVLSFAVSTHYGPRYRDGLGGAPGIEGKRGKTEFPVMTEKNLPMTLGK